MRAVRAGIPQHVLVCTKGGLRMTVTEPPCRAGPAPWSTWPQHAKRRPCVWCTAVVLPAIGAIALWQGLGAFLERLDEAAVPHRVG